MSRFTDAHFHTKGQRGSTSSGPRKKITVRMPVDMATTLKLLANAKGCAENQLIVELLKIPLRPPQHELTELPATDGGANAR